MWAPNLCHLHFHFTMGENLDLLLNCIPHDFRLSIVCPVTNYCLFPSLIFGIPTQSALFHCDKISGFICVDQRAQNLHGGIDKSGYCQKHFLMES